MPTEVIDLDVEEEDSIQPNHAPALPPPSSDLEPAEISEPAIDIQSQFKRYNEKHFSNRIINTTVEYSKRMTLCAGTCTFRPPNIRIALSEPLLKLRPRSDLLSTLVHEMIHAYLFLTKGLARDGPDGHGPVFMSHAKRINATEPAVNITPYHEFRAEVDHYRVHHWRCEKCYNLIKRAMNRAPAPTDQFWPFHQKQCGGTYIKIAGPPNKEKPPKLPRNRAIAVATNGSERIPKGIMKTYRIDDMLSGRTRKKCVTKMASCPVCAVSVKEDEMNQHLDTCLAEGLFTQPSNAVPAERKRTPFVISTKVTKDHFPRTTEPDRISKDTPLSKDVRCSVPTEVQSPPNFQRPCNRLAFSNATNSREPFDVMNYIADPNALRDLALNPKKFQPEQVNKIFKDLPPRTSEPHQTFPENGIKDFLRSLIHPEAPFCREQQAKAIINALRVGPDDEEFSLHAISERWGMSLTSIWELIDQNSLTDESGRFVFSTELIDILSSDHPPTSNNSACLTSLKRPRSNTDIAGYCDRQVNHDTEKISVGIRSDATRRIQTEAYETPPRKLGRTTERTFGERCPICDQSVAKGGLDEHIRECVTGSEERENEQTNEIPLGGSETSQALRSDAPRSQTQSRDVPGQKRKRCPICDTALSRQDLEAHVATCMLSAGLADAF